MKIKYRAFFHASCAFALSMNLTLAQVNGEILPNPENLFSGRHKTANYNYDTFYRNEKCSDFGGVAAFSNKYSEELGNYTEYTCRGHYIHSKTSLPSTENNYIGTIELSDQNTDLYKLADDNCRNLGGVKIYPIYRGSTNGVMQYSYKCNGHQQVASTDLTRTEEYCGSMSKVIDTSLCSKKSSGILPPIASHTNSTFLREQLKLAEAREAAEKLANARTEAERQRAEKAEAERLAAEAKIGDGSEGDLHCKAQKLAPTTPKYLSCRKEFDAATARRRDEEVQRQREAEKKLAEEAVRRAEHERIMQGDGTPDHRSCVSFGFVPATAAYSECRLRIDLARREEEQRQRAYELQLQQYQQQAVAEEDRKKKERQTAMRKFGLSLMSGNSFSDAAREAEGMAPMPKPSPPPQVNVQINMPNGSGRRCLFNSRSELVCN